MEGRAIFDRDYARASLLQALCEKLGGFESVMSRRRGLDAINRLDKRKHWAGSDFKQLEDVHKLCPYDYLDSLDFDYELLGDPELGKGVRAGVFAAKLFGKATGVAAAFAKDSPDK